MTRPHEAPDHARHALIALAGPAALRADPIQHFRFRGPGQRKLVEYVVAGLDAHAHAPNSGGKTKVSAALAVALCRGARELDGVRLPGLGRGESWVHWVLVPTRKQQVQASQKALLEMLGDWPHELGYSSRANDYIETIWIKPEWCTSGERGKWSKLVIHCEESAGESVPGGRVNSVNADECPARKVWEEVRARWILGRPLLKWIAETPTKKSRWWWIFHEESGYLNCLDRPREGRVSVNWPLADIHSAEQIEEVKRSYRGDSVIGARLTGLPVNDEGTSPFDPESLAWYRDQCQEPGAIWAFPLGESGRIGKVQVWCEPKSWWRARIVVDPSAGIDDGKHDPNGFLVGEECDPAIVMRYNGYLDPYSLGLLAGATGEKIAKVAGSHPWIDVEMQNGWGGETIRALRQTRYPNIGHRMLVVDPQSKRVKHYGFPNTDEGRSGWIGAIQIGLMDRLFKCWSSEVIDCLVDVQLVDGKAEKQAGCHIEDMIELGYFLHRTGLPRAIPPEIQRDADPFRQTLRREFPAWRPQARGDRRRMPTFGLSRG